MEQRRLLELDGLRGIAAMMVVLFHYYIRYDGLYGHSETPSSIFNIGYYGVHLFFIVSGFVIFWTVSRSKRPIDFIWARFTRLYPVYWAALICTYFVVSTVGLSGRESDINTFFMNLLMFHEYLNYEHVDGVYWTLTLELAFYLWIVVLFVSNQIKFVEIWLLGWVSFACFLIHYHYHFSIHPLLYKLFLLQYIEFFTLGITLFKVFKHENTHLTSLLIVVCFVTIFSRYEVMVAFLLLIFTAIFYASIRWGFMFLQSKYLVFLGSISYALYLIHQNIGYIIINKMYGLGSNSHIAVFIAFLCSVILAAILTYKVEKPMIDVLRTFYKKTT